jgi:hypothetical protein
MAATIFPAHTYWRASRAVEASAATAFCGVWWAGDRHMAQMLIPYPTGKRTPRRARNKTAKAALDAA